MGSAGQARLVVVAVVAALALGVAVVTWQLRAPSLAPAVRTTIRPSATLLLSVRDLGRLESTEMHLERVIAMTDTQRVLFGLAEAEDSILLVAAADVVAGVDLGAIDADDVFVADDGSATLTVPHAVVFSSRLDAERTTVHARDTDLLAERSADLESRARREAERTIEAAALEAGILERAERSAARTLAALLGAMGHERVEVRFR
jgi:hypothetical protein